MWVRQQTVCLFIWWWLHIRAGEQHMDCTTHLAVICFAKRFRVHHLGSFVCMWCPCVNFRAPNIIELYLHLLLGMPVPYIGFLRPFELAYACKPYGSYSWQCQPLIASCCCLVGLTMHNAERAVAHCLPVQCVADRVP